MRFGAGAIAVLFALAPAPAKAGDDSDLIPQGILDHKPELEATSAAGQTAFEASSAFDRKAFAEEALSLWSPSRVVPVPYPPALGFAWQNRASLDAALRWRAHGWTRAVHRR